MSLAAYTYVNTNIPVNQLQKTEYSEALGSGEEVYSAGNSNCKRTFYHPWTNRLSFVNDMLGYSSVRPGVHSNYSNISRVLPDAHPENPLWFAMDGAAQPVTDDPPLVSTTIPRCLQYQVARITANYRYVDYRVLEDNQVTNGYLGEWDRYMSRNYNPHNEYFSVRGQMKYVQSGQATGKQPQKINNSTEIICTWHEVPPIPATPQLPPNVSAVNACIGTLNSVPWDVNNGSYPAQTVLFAGYTAKQITAKLGLPGAQPLQFFWEVEMKFMVRDYGLSSAFYSPREEIGWQWQWDQPNSRWDLMTTNGNQATGGRLYLLSDHNTLTQIG